jgi:hydrogenase/urease accessory protein HupE
VRIERQKLVMSILVLKNPIAAGHQLPIWIGARVVKLFGFNHGAAILLPIRMPKKHSGGIGFLDQELNAARIKYGEGSLKDGMNNLCRCAGKNRSTVDGLRGFVAEQRSQSRLYSGQFQIQGISLAAFSSLS